MDLPTPLSRWAHRNGIVYKVVALTNLPNDERYPLTVVYQNEQTGSLWSRRADDWHRSFTALPIA
mgnify:CR=1 FL=1